MKSVHRNLSVACCIFVLMLVAEISFAQEKNPTVYPYGGVPDSSRRINFISFDNPDDNPVKFVVPLSFNSAIFGGAHFDSVANFENALFSNDANFTFAQFDNRASFHSTRFAKVADFSNTPFDSLADFSYASFNMMLILGGLGSID